MRSPDASSDRGQWVGPGVAFLFVLTLMAWMYGRGREIELADGLMVLGHLSFAITFLSYAQRSIVKLRLLAIASLVLGLVYNTWVHLRMPPGQDLWPVLIWLSVFFVQNVTLAARAVTGEMEVALSQVSRTLLATTMPSMHSRDWRALEALARKERYSNGEVLLEVGDRSSCVSLLVAGQVQLDRADLPAETKYPGELWGELSYVLGRDQYNASPCKIAVLSAEVEIWSFDYDLIDAVCFKNDRARAALNDGFIRAAGMKHGTIKHQAEHGGYVAPKPHAGVSSIALSQDLLILQADAFPKLNSSAMAELATRFQQRSVASGESIALCLEIGLIVHGAVLVERTDNQAIVLHGGSCIGEIGYFTPGATAVAATLTAQGPVRLVTLSYADLAALRNESPALYAAVLEAFAGLMATKLGRALSPINTYEFGAVRA